VLVTVVAAAAGEVNDADQGAAEKDIQRQAGIA
jgi:hypothetical protein